MHRIDNATAVAALPVPAAVGPNPDHYFTKGNPGSGIPATIVDDDWANAVQEELAYVIEQAGLTLNKTTNTQLRQAIQSMIVSAQKAVIISGVIFQASVTDGEVVYWDSANSRFDEALADGSAAQNAVGVADVTNSKVYVFGDAVLFSGLTPGSKYYLSTVTPGAVTAVAPASNIVQIGIAKTATEIFVDIDSIAGAGVLPGTIIEYSGTTAPAGYLLCPTAATNISRTTYAALFAAIGTTWGVGDGATTFGMPYFPADYAAIQANSNVGTSYVGQVIAHSHTYGNGGIAGSGFPVLTNGLATNQPTSSTGGAANLAAGIRVLRCVKF